jgi:hypothetical protein
MSLKEIDEEIKRSDALAALFQRMHKLGWPKYEDDPELCMARVREFLDGAKAIYPNA